MPALYTTTSSKVTGLSWGLYETLRPDAHHAPIRKAGNPAKAECLLADMEEHDLKPDVISYLKEQPLKDISKGSPNQTKQLLYGEQMQTHVALWVSWALTAI